MKRLFIVLAVLVGALALGATIGCKKGNKVDDVCAHLAKFVDNGSYSKEECTNDMKDVTESCKNPDVVFDCMLAANKEEDLGACEEKCQEK
jgi:hypothetical protein